MNMKSENADRKACDPGDMLSQGEDIHDVLLALHREGDFSRFWDCVEGRGWLRTASVFLWGFVEELSAENEKLRAAEGHSAQTDRISNLLAGSETMDGEPLTLDASPDKIKEAIAEIRNYRPPAHGHTIHNIKGREQVAIRRIA